MALTETAHQLIREHFVGADLSNKVAVDATCGNGHDTVFLTTLGFDRVHTFDIQAIALDITRQRLSEAQLNNTTLIHDGHENLRHYIETDIECAMFNLGYMPNADKSITTTEKNSLAAIKSTLENLSSTGIVSIICYPGHIQGAQETKAIQNWFSELNLWHIRELLAEHPNPRAPILYLITKTQ